jgi:hypothetical protein
MQPTILISVLIFTLIVIGILIGFLLAIRNSTTDLNPQNKGKHPRGYWMSVGISIGVAIGVALGPLFGNIGIGIAIGIAIGSDIGASLERKNKVRPLTEQENKERRWAVIVGLLIMPASVIAITLLLFSRIK